MDDFLTYTSCEEFYSYEDETPSIIENEERPLDNFLTEPTCEEFYTEE